MNKAVGNLNSYMGYVREAVDAMGKSVADMMRAMRMRKEGTAMKRSPIQDMRNMAESISNVGKDLGYISKDMEMINKGMAEMTAAVQDNWGLRR